MSILIVEDDPDIAEVLTLLLRDEGYQTHTVPSVEKALASLTVEEMPALILLDLRFSGFSGFDFLEELNTRYPVRPCPVVVISAASGSDLEDHLYTLGVADLVRKPFDIEQVLSVVSRWYPTSIYSLRGA